MTLAPLITAADLSARGIPSDGLAVTADIAAASAAIRDAAGVAITRSEMTVTVPGTRDKWLSLPVRPVVSVSAVMIDEEGVSDWRLVGGRLWRPFGWWTTLWSDRAGWVFGPTNVTVTLVAGAAEAPADIVDLACSLVAGAQHERTAGSHRGEAYERLDDYQVGYVTDTAAERVSAFELPDRTKTMLRERFGGSAYVTGDGS